ncbi:hypothetical protein [Paraburkholderia sp. RL17-337-BIB-A]|uniref:hypothetical protein n=1 Tax=Paraburkholderia sp. RL17-337-BIB-A TaxID=3031636 RepID=UPI0038BCC4C0
MSRFLCLSFFAAAKKVSAAPHRGNTNRPISIQGKANATKAQTTKRRWQQIQEKANATGKQTISPARATKSGKYQHRSQTNNKRHAGNQINAPQRRRQNQPLISQ